MRLPTSTCPTRPSPGSRLIDGHRTCVGCRQRAEAEQLLRIVVARDSTGEIPVVVPDPRRRLPGRGAWLHASPECLALAARRRAFGRALRVPGTVDSAAVDEYVASTVQQDDTSRRRYEQ